MRRSANHADGSTSELPTIRELTLVCAHRGSTAALPEASDNGYSVTRSNAETARRYQLNCDSRAG